MLTSRRQLPAILLVEFYLVAMAALAYELWNEGLLARYGGLATLGFGGGVHEYAVFMLLTAAVLGVTLAKGAFWRGAIFPFVAYGVHEAVFNAFFLTYHWEVPGSEFYVWWIEVAFMVSVTAASLAFGLLKKSKPGLVMLGALTALTLVWAGMGFPVTTDIFATAAQNAKNNVSLIPNLFEVLWNLVSISFISLVYRWR